MTPAHAISGKTERVLQKIAVKAVNHDSGGGHALNVINGSESGSYLSKMKRIYFLTIMIWNATDNRADRNELKNLILHKWAINQRWFDSATYLTDLSYRAKIDGLIDCAINNLPHKNRPSNAHIANCICMRSETYRKSQWKNAFAELEQTLKQWLLDAANIIHKNCQ